MEQEIAFWGSAVQDANQASIQLLNMNTNCRSEEDCDFVPKHDRCSNASTQYSPTSASPKNHNFQDEQLLPQLPDMRCGLFESGSEGLEISQKVSQRAVCWLMTVSWSRDIDQESLWAALLLFYLFKLQGKVRKEGLELLLLTCLMLATKLHSSRPLSANDVASLSRSTPQAVAQLEGELLESVDFDIVIPHYLSELPRCSALSPDNLPKLQLLCQLMMMRSCRVFFDRARLTALIKLLQGEEHPEGEQIRKEIKQIMSFKDSQIVLRKFRSKMDVEAFTDSFLN